MISCVAGTNGVLVADSTEHRVWSTQCSGDRVGAMILREAPQGNPTLLLSPQAPTPSPVPVADHSPILSSGATAGRLSMHWASSSHLTGRGAL